MILLNVIYLASNFGAKIMPAALVIREKMPKMVILPVEMSRFLLLEPDELSKM